MERIFDLTSILIEMLGFNPMNEHRLNFQEILGLQRIIDMFE